MFIISILLSLDLCYSRVSSALHYKISAVFIADTEIYEAYTEPVDESVWIQFAEDARNLGLLFAGKAEFSWVVDLRLHREDQELWSTGNLFSAAWVMTTCRAKTYLEEAWQNADALTKELTVGAVLTYFQLYYWEYVENNNWYENKGKWAYGGTRRIDSYVIHPNCDLKKMKFDIAMLKLKDEIAPASPFIGYMPAAKDPNDDRKFANIEFSKLEAKKKICFVGSVGRNYINWLNGLVLDFKVRFRVYYEPIDRCTNLVNRLCNSTRYDCSDAFSAPNAQGREWECMRTRARVGTVCDHDRGAPVVCDDEVVGMVGYGALYQNCNNRIPMPFLVIKLHTFSEWTQTLTLSPKREPWAGNN